PGLAVGARRAESRRGAIAGSGANRALAAPARLSPEAAQPVAPRQTYAARKPRACPGGFAVSVDSVAGSRNPHYAALRTSIEARTARVGVVGLGYVGLPLAVEFARAGFVTTGIDLDPRKIDPVSQGTSYIPDVETAEVARLVSGGKLNATSDFSIVAELDTVNICVPTPLRKTKDP